MKSTLRILPPLLLLSGGVVAVPVSAADSDETHTEMAMDELASRLDLTAEQQARIAPALEERNRKLKALAANRNPDAARREKLKSAREARAIQQEFVGKVEPVLTKEQKAQWARMREEARDRMRDRAGERSPRRT